MTDNVEVAAIPTAKIGILTVAVIIPVIIGWIILGTAVFKLSSFYASFLFAWYWFSIENADFKKWIPTLIGALVGLGFCFLAHMLPQSLGETAGLLTILALLSATLFLQITNMIPIAFNHSTMLFLTVLAAPALLTTMNFGEVAAAIVLGAIYFAGIAKLAQFAANRPSAK
jgi:hypothetical protein